MTQLAHHGHGAHTAPPGGNDTGRSRDRHAGHGPHGEIFRRRFWVSLVLAVPIVVFSAMFADLLGYPLPDAAWAGWVSPVLGTVVFVYGGSPFLVGGWNELRDRRPGMMLLIAMAISVAFAASWVTTLGLGGFDLDFWWELALLIVIMLLGHWLEMRALGSASRALDALAAMLPDTAEKVTADGVVPVPLGDLTVGDVALVRAGARVPADGTVVDGRAEVDESMITGESRAVPRAVGDTVVAGTIATDSALRVRITAVGEDTALAGIQRMVADAQASSSRAQALADRAAAFLFYFATLAGVLTFAVWTLLGNLDEAVVRTVTVLVIACPHALGLAIPLVIAISTERAARAGVLVKDRLSLERMRGVDVVLFDKTGTLTQGRHVVTDVVATAGTTEDDLLALAAAVESDSEHPVARAVVAAAGGRAAVPAKDFRSLPGRGVRAVVDGATVFVGGPAVLADLGAHVPADVEAATGPWVARGASVLHVVRDGAVLGAVALEDAVREESRQAIDALHARGVKVAMITGDALQVADAVAADLGIDEVFANVLPEHKDAKVAELQARGHRVAMVGDGVNDAPALEQADIGVAMGITGTDVSKSAADMILTDDNFATIVAAVEEGRGIYANIVKFVKFQLTTAWGFVLIFLVSGALGLAGGAPFTALQILWVNIIMDGPPALALGVDPTEPGTMSRPPRPAHERLLSRDRLRRILGLGIVMTAGTVAVLHYAPQWFPESAGDPLFATTLAFTTFVFFQVFNLLNVRSELGSVFSLQTLTNHSIWIALVVVVVLQVCVVQTAFLQGFFDTTALTSQQWALAVGVGSSVLWVDELVKATGRSLRRRRGDAHARSGA